MAFSLSLQQIQDKGANAALISLFKDSGADLDWVWGETKPLAPGGAQYVIKMSPTNLEVIRKQLSKTKKNWTTIKSSGVGKAITLANKEDFKYKLDSSGKTPAGVGSAKSPTTAQQEKVTLRIFQELLQKKGPDYAQIGFYGPKGLMMKELKKIYSDIDHASRKDWLKHFELQYNEVRDVTKLPNNKFDVFDYDEFMDYLVGIIIGGPATSGTWPLFGKISQKDSWNPADVWLIQEGTKFNKIKEKLKTSGTIKELNAVLKVAFHEDIVTGISLKKSSGKPGGLHYELVNLESKLKNLPKITLGKFKLDLPFDGDTGKFEKTTNEISVENNKKVVASMRTGSNTTGVGNNTYEFKPVGAATAMLGKVPKDLMLKRFQAEGINIDSLPTWQEMSTRRPKTTGDIQYNYWKGVVKTVSSSPLFNIPSSWDINTFPEDLVIAGDKPDIEKTESAVMQIMEFAYLLTKIEKKKKRKGVDEFFEDLYYFAQKKGVVFGSEFGPFGKLY